MLLGHQPSSNVKQMTCDSMRDPKGYLFSIHGFRTRFSKIASNHPTISFINLITFSAIDGFQTSTFLLPHSTPDQEIPPETKIGVSQTSTASDRAGETP